MAKFVDLLQQISSSDGLGTNELMSEFHSEIKTCAEMMLGSFSGMETLQSTALVNEAYLRLVGPSQELTWTSKGHFFGAAAKVMREILLNEAKRKKTVKHGGNHQKIPLDDVLDGLEMQPDWIISFNESLEKLESVNSKAALLVDLRFIAGQNMEECSLMLDIPLRSAERLWSTAKAFLYRELGEDE